MLDYGVQVLWVARYDYSKGQILKKHSHNFYQMIYIINGSGEFLLDSEKISICSEQIFLIRPGQLHGLTPAAVAKVKTLDIKFSIKEKALGDKLIHLERTIFCRQPDIRTLFERIREEGMSRNCYYNEFASLYLNQILLTLLRENDQSDAQKGLSEGSIAVEAQGTVCVKTVQYFKQHYYEDVALADVAACLGYHPSYLCQCFKKEYQCTPMQFLYQYRIKKGKELIAYSDYSFKQIAEMTGFKTIHHFTRMFGQIEGMPPKQWREIEKEGIRKDIYY